MKSCRWYPSWLLLVDHERAKTDPATSQLLLGRPSRCEGASRPALNSAEAGRWSHKQVLPKGLWQRCISMVATLADDLRCTCARHGRKAGVLCWFSSPSSSDGDDPSGLIADKPDNGRCRSRWYRSLVDGKVSGESEIRKSVDEVMTRCMTRSWESDHV